MSFHADRRWPASRMSAFLRSAGVPAALLLCSLFVQSCGGPPSPPPAHPVLYAELRESIEGVDTSALEGAKIVIDPGHGGPYAGAIGPEGLREADVNLGVALNLWGLLSDAGADVTLTRSSDRTAVEDEDASLRDDLLARAETANEIEADVFLSIHHNSDLSRDPAINRIETYHKLFDAGPSVDVARALHDHLSYNIGESRGGVIPGNYMVLRSCDGPAALGEPSFISNPEIEKKLKDAGVQRMEAVAYFLGLLDYFSKGVPRVRRVAPAVGAPAGPRPAIRIAADPGRAAGIDPAGVELLLDDEPVRADYNPADSLITFTPADPLAAGEHTVLARVRNSGGNWSSALSFVFEVQTDPAHLILNPLQERGATADVPYAIEARVYDFFMNPAADGTPVTFRSDRPVFPETSLVRSGRAICYVVPASLGSFEIEARCGKASMGLIADPAQTGVRERVWWAFLRDGTDGAPVAGAAISIDGRRVGKINRDGFASFALPGQEGGVWRVSAPGYEWHAGGRPELVESPYDTSTESTVRVLGLARAAGGLLHGLTFAIDPEGGGDDRAGQGPSGTDASWVNYEVAAGLSGLIEGAGGEVILTRERNGGASNVQRLIAAESAAATRYMLISHRPMPKEEGAWIGHYPGSSTGQALAAAIASSSERILKLETPVIRENANYALRQTSSPAVNINLIPLSDRKAERYISQPWNAAREAYAIYAGLLEHLDRDGKLGAGSLEFRISLEDGGPAKAVRVTVDGYLNLRADERGTVVVAALAPGTHQLEVALQGYNTELWEFTWPPDAGGAPVRIELAPE